MGNYETITLTGFPTQSDQIGKQCSVCFWYDTKNQIGGTIIRDDMEDPWRTIIKLNDGRFVLGTECQYRLDP